MKRFFSLAKSWCVLSLMGALSLTMVFGQKYVWKNYEEREAREVMTQGRKIPIYCVETDKNEVAISFDAAWGNEDTQKILDILKQENVCATFFMTGGWVNSYPDDVKRIAAGGHELGNHSENHKQMSTLSAQECKEEIMKVHERVRTLTGKEMKVFRPPYGDYNNTLLDTLEECGYQAVQWDVDSLDWKEYGVDAMISQVLQHKHLGKGSIILCHNGAKYTARALPTLIRGLKEKGFKLVTMSELIYPSDHEIDAEGRQKK